MPTILLVEDDLALAMHWRQALEAEDYRVIHEPSVEGAIDVLDGTSIDVVITDIVLETNDDQLRDAGGFAVISYIALNLDPQPKFIATSGEASNSNFVDRNFKKMDSMRALRKPISAEKLVAIVHDLLNDAEEPQRKVALDDERIRRLIYSDEAMLELLAVWDWKVGTDEATFTPGFRKLLGFEGNDVQGFPDTLEAFADRIHSDDKESIWAEVNNSLRDETPFVHDFRLKCKNGSYIWVRSQATASFDDRGNALRMVGSTHDITDELALKQEARRTNEHFNWAMTNANIGVWEWDLKTNAVTFSETWKTQLGYPPETEWSSFADWERLLHPDDQEGAVQRAKGLAADPHSRYESTFRLRTASGEYRWIRSVGSGLFAEDGTPERFIGLHLDIHDLQVAKQNAEESEARFRALTDSASPLAWTTELDSTCSWLNKRWLEYSGTTLESQLGYGWIETVHEDDRERVQASYMAAFKKHEAFVLDYRLRRHDGTYRWFTVNATPRFDESGAFCGYVGMSFDSHDTRLARESLEASEKRLTDALRELSHKEQRLELAVTGTTDGLWDWNIKTNEVWYAPRFRELLGYNIDGDDRFPPVLDSFGDSLHPEDKEHTWAAIEAHFDDNKPYDVRYRLRKSDGTYIWCRARGAAVRDAEGKAIRMSGSVQDISDLVKAENQLVQINQNLEATNAELEQFAYVASHDLRTPIRGISSIVSFIRDDEADNLSESSLQYLDKLDGRVCRMEALLDDMLAYSRVGKQAERTETVDTVELVAETIDLLSLPETFQVSIVGELPTLKILRSPLQQVFLNLIGNAQKYHDRENGRIEIKSSDTGRFVRFTVSDDGPGIKKAFHEKIFEMFQRLHNRDDVEGTGLGLALVRKLVRQLGGDIWVESNLGEGATFHFTWPRIVEEE